MKFTELKSALTQNFYPVLLAIGEDAFLRNKAVELAIQSCNVEYPDMNVQIFGDNASLDDVVIACETFPFCSEHKVVVARDFALAEPKNEQAVKSRKRLIDYTALPNTQCCLIFTAEKDNSAFNALNAERIDCTKLGREEIAKWITTKLKQNGLSITRQAAYSIGEYCLRDMSRVYNETQKLISYMDEGSEVNQDIVDMLVHKDIEYAVFDLSNAIGDKNTTRAKVLLDDMLATGQKPRDLYKMLYRYYRRLFYASITKLPTADVAAALKVKEYSIISARDTIKKHTPILLKKSMDLFYSIESRGLKRTLTEEQLQTLVLQLINL